MVFPHSKLIGALAAFIFMGTACSGESGDSAKAEGEELAFSDEADGPSIACGKAIARVIDTRGALAAEDQASLMATWSAAVPEIRTIADSYLAGGADASPESVELLRQIDDATYTSCGLPVYSVAASLAGSSALHQDKIASADSTDDDGADDKSVFQSRSTLPCYVFSTESDPLANFLFMPVECASGDEVFLQSDGSWQTKPQVPAAPTTTAIPPTTLPRVTRPQPVTTLAPPTTTPPSSVESGGTNPDGSELDESDSEETTTSTGLQVTPNI